jgi:hypothetical protein
MIPVCHNWRLIYWLLTDYHHLRSSMGAAMAAMFELSWTFPRTARVHADTVRIVLVLKITLPTTVSLLHFLQIPTIH